MSLTTQFHVPPCKFVSINKQFTVWIRRTIDEPIRAILTAFSLSLFAIVFTLPMRDNLLVL